jgi:hypothetical protein
MELFKFLVSLFNFNFNLGFRALNNPLSFDCPALETAAILRLANWSLGGQSAQNVSHQQLPARRSRIMRAYSV